MVCRLRGGIAERLPYRAIKLRSRKLGKGAFVSQPYRGANLRSLSAFPVRRRLEKAIEVAAQVGERAQPVEEMKRPAAAGRATAL